MANSILVLGNSGEGKTFSMLPNKEMNIIGLDPNETFVINVANKPLPIRGFKKKYTLFSKDNQSGNLFYSSNFEIISSLITRIPDIFQKVHNRPLKNIVIDDVQYLLTASSMSKINEKGFDKFNQLCKGFFDIINAGCNLPLDINFIMLAHTEIEDGAYKLKTIGKAIDSQINPIGYFTYVLTTTVNFDVEGKPIYQFYTNRTMDNRGILVPSKTPPGIFNDIAIPNDLGYVIQKIDEYNNE